MAGRNKAIPINPMVFPEYEYQEYPKMLAKIKGGAPDGTDLLVIANDKKHEQELREEYEEKGEPLPVFRSTAPITALDFNTAQDHIAALKAELLKFKSKDEIESIAPTNERLAEYMASQPTSEAKPKAGVKDGSSEQGDDPWSGQAPSDDEITAAAKATADKAPAGGNKLQAPGAKKK
jgi:hypothetical protein